MVKILRKIISKRRSLYYHKLGIKIGKNSKIEKDVFIDPSFPWLVSIGNNVTIAPRTFILAHDGSTKKQIGYSKIGRVIIEDNVFIGANCTILPNVKIGQNSIIGAGSVVTKDIPENVLAVGNPAKVIKKYDFVQVVDGLSVSEDLFNRGICLPSDTKNTDEDMDRIIGIIKGCFEKVEVATKC